MLHLDGSCFSGSGTIVRFGLPLAALTGQALHLANVRTRRASPGLRPQHLQAVEAVTELCQDTLEGGTIGSQELVFDLSPSDYRPRADQCLAGGNDAGSPVAPGGASALDRRRRVRCPHSADASSHVTSWLAVGRSAQATSGSKEAAKQHVLCRQSVPERCSKTPCCR
jgi:hypothetical protein